MDSIHYDSHAGGFVCELSGEQNAAIRKARKHNGRLPEGVRVTHDAHPELVGKTKETVEEALRLIEDWKKLE